VCSIEYGDYVKTEKRRTGEEGGTFERRILARERIGLI